jgi:hypothetical protein
MRLKIQVLVLLGILYSCQMSEVSSDKTASWSGSDRRFEKVMPSSISNSGVEDPNSVEPEMPGGGETGGDLNFILPTAPKIDDGVPIILAGKSGAAFTQSGSSSGQNILFTTAEPTVPRPLIVAPSARGLKMTVSVKYNNARYIVRFYHSVTTYNGTINLWTDPQPVQVVIGSLGPAQAYQNADYGQMGELLNPGQWTISSPVGQVSGQLFISQLSFNAQGQITLKAVLTIPGKTININYINWNRWS